MRRPEMSLYMADPTIVLGHPRAITTMMAIAGFVVFYIGVVIEYQEPNNRFYCLTFLHYLRNGSIDVTLDSDKRRKFCIKMNVLFHMLLYQAFYSMFLPSLTISIL